MEKPQILLVGIVAIAVVFFAMRFTSRSDSGLDDYEYGSADRLAMARGAGGGGSGGRGESAGRSVSGRPHEVSRSLGGRGGDGRGYERREGFASTLSAGSRERRGSVGQGSHSALSTARESGLAALGGEARGSAAGGGSAATADRMELLSGKQADVDPFYEGNETDSNPNDDVVLEVNNVDDADRKARDAVDIKEGDDGVGLDIGEDSVLTFPNAGNVNADQGSIAVDITPQWNGNDPTDNSFMQLRTENEWNNRMQLVKNGPFLRFILTDATGHEADISYRIDHWQQGEEYKVTATWADGKTNLYVNGQPVGSNEYPGPFEIPPGTPLYVGSDLPGGSYKGANGRLTARVYNRALAGDEIF